MIRRTSGCSSLKPESCWAWKVWLCPWSYASSAINVLSTQVYSAYLVVLKKSCHENMESLTGVFWVMQSYLETFMCHFTVKLRLSCCSAVDGNQQKITGFSTYCLDMTYLDGLLLKLLWSAFSILSRGNPYASLGETNESYYLRIASEIQVSV